MRCARVERPSSTLELHSLACTSGSELSHNSLQNAAAQAATVTLSRTSPIPFVLSLLQRPLARTERPRFEMGASLARFEMGASLARFESGASLRRLEIGASLTRFEMGASLARLLMGAPLARLELIGTPFSFVVARFEASFFKGGGSGFAAALTAFSTSLTGSAGFMTFSI